MIVFGDELTRLENDHPGRPSVTHVLTSRDRRVDEDGVLHCEVCRPGPLMVGVQGVFLTRLGFSIDSEADDTALPTELAHNLRPGSPTHT
ncbi:hypothetical protein ABZ890_29300 [Streptomyces sp. NPDC046984]|uniref:hypothetical protein n=1 Tax=Streptomyces sp. NPDC046984 TaxID=3155138 RepID=UPI0033E46634